MLLGILEAVEAARPDARTVLEVQEDADRRVASGGRCAFCRCFENVGAVPPGPRRPGRAGALPRPEQAGEVPARPAGVRRARVPRALRRPERARVPAGAPVRRRPARPGRVPQALRRRARRAPGAKLCLARRSASSCSPESQPRESAMSSTARPVATFSRSASASWSSVMCPARTSSAWSGRVAISSCESSRRCGAPPTSGVGAAGVTGGSTGNVLMGPLGRYRSSWLRCVHPLEGLHARRNGRFDR